MNQAIVQHSSGIHPMDRDLDLLTLGEAAKLLKVSVVTLRRWIRQGRLPAYHVGPRKVRIKRSDLTTLLTLSRSRGEVSVVKESNPLSLSPLTDEEITQGLAALREADAVIEAIRERRGGQPLDSSVPLIRRARETRAKQLL